MDVDSEGRERRGVYLPRACWDFLEVESAKSGLARSDMLEGLVLLAMDRGGVDVVKTTSYRAEKP